MIRRSPCELYIKFLLLHPNSYAHSTIEEKLQEMGLDCPGPRYIAALSRELEPPSPFRPLDIHHTWSQRFLLGQRLDGFFHPNEDASMAHKLVTLPRCKETIETMVLVKEPHAVISHVLRSQGHDCSVGAIDHYCRYYWDLTVVDSVEVNALIALRHKHLIHRNDGEDVTASDRAQAEALKHAGWKDPRRIPVEMQITPIAALLNRMRMGFMPTGVDLTRMAESARVAAIARAWGATMEFSKFSAAEARDFSVVAATMTTLLSEVGSPDSVLQEELQALALQTDGARPPSIHQLSDGHHTVDLQPVTIDTEAEPVDV